MPRPFDAPGALRAGLVWTVFLDNRRKDEPKCDKPCQVEQWLSFVGRVNKSKRKSGRGIKSEPDRKQQEKAIARLAPETKKKERRHERRHGDRPGQDGVQGCAHSVLQIMP
jgi:hypothetical protein